MTQSRKASALESVVNVGSGFVVAYLTWLYLIPWLWGIPTRMDRGLGVTLTFTVISIIRCYVWRRIFNK